MFSFLTDTEFFNRVTEDSVFVLSIVVTFSAISSIQSSLEWLSISMDFGDDRLFSWKLTRLELSKSIGRRILTVLNYLFTIQGVKAILFCQITFSLLLLFHISLAIDGVCCLGISICYFLLTLRGVDGFNGGDSMTKIVILASAIGFIFHQHEATLYFIAFQLVLAYSTAGWLRIPDKKWYSGKHLMNIMRQKTFGKEQIWKFLRQYSWIPAMISTCLVLFESLFLVILFLQTEYQLIFLFCGIVFHLTNAIVMRLNTFIWPFIGSYPSIIWVSTQLSL